MRQMCAVEYGRLAEELQALVGKRLSKISKLETGYRLRIGDADIICQPPARMHITKYIEESEEADAFVEKARKEIKGAKLEAVEQINGDRILMLGFGECKLYLEMFAKGNLVLVKEGKTIAALRHEQWADREIKPNLEYRPPKAPPQNPRDVISDRYIIVSLLRLPIGKEYVEELLARTGISEKAAGNSLSEKQLENLEKELEKMKTEFKPCGFYENGKIIDFGLLKFSKYSKLEARDFKTIAEAADEYYWENKPEEEPEGLEKLKSRLEKQREYVAALRKEELELRAAGDWFYANYAYVEKLIEEACAVGIKNIEKLKENYPEITGISKGKKEIEIEVQ